MDLLMNLQYSLICPIIYQGNVNKSQFELLLKKLKLKTKMVKDRREGARNKKELAL
jgi:hypothetical protein